MTIKAIHKEIEEINGLITEARSRLEDLLWETRTDDFGDTEHFEILDELSWQINECENQIDDVIENMANDL